MFRYTRIFFFVILFIAGCSPSLKISEYAITQKSLFVNKKIASLPLAKYDIRILKIKRNGKFLRYFDNNTKINLNDTLYLVGTSTQLEKIYKYFDVKK